MKSLMKTRMAALGTMLVIFIAGMAVGMLVDRSLAEAAPEEEVVRVDAGDEERRRGSMIHQVDLTPEQRVQVDSMVGAFRERMKHFHESSRSEYDRIVREARESIKAILDEEQRARYEALLEERDRHRRD